MLKSKYWYVIELLIHYFILFFKFNYDTKKITFLYHISYFQSMTNFYVYNWYFHSITYLYVYNGYFKVFLFKDNQFKYQDFFLTYLITKFKIHKIINLEPQI